MLNSRRKDDHSDKDRGPTAVGLKENQNTDIVIEGQAKGLTLYMT